MWFFTILKSFFVGGTLEKLLDVINTKITDETKREEIKAEVTKKWIDAQAALLVGRTWWFQLFFVVPLGLWWTAVILDSIFGFEHDIAALPFPLDTWAGWIVSSVFLVDQAKALIGRIKQ
jgi:hypothetical protein